MKTLENIPSPKKLRALAKWIDDMQMGQNVKNVEYHTNAWDTEEAGQAQKDLRRWAKNIAKKDK